MNMLYLPQAVKPIDFMYFADLLRDGRSFDTYCYCECRPLQAKEMSPRVQEELSCSQDRCIFIFQILICGLAYGFIITLV